MIFPTQILVLKWAGEFDNTNESWVLCGLPLTLLVLAAARCLCCLAVPRRPDVYRQGKLVDQEYTISLLNRLTFRWADRFLKHTVQNRRLDIDDLHQLRECFQAASQYRQLESNRVDSRSLWKALMATYRKPWLLLLLLSFFYSLLGFGPQVALYQLLRCLESEDGLKTDFSAWYWVAALGLCTVVAATVDIWMWWTMYAKLGLSVYEGLLGVIYNKAMRGKDLILHDISKESDGEKTATRTSLTNLAAVDSQRVTDFTTNTYMIPAFITKITVSCVMLVTLIGPTSLIAGLVVAASVVPLKTLLTRHYTKLQGQLMKVVDSRNTKVAEMLGGVRQIKFTAMEAHWEADIRHERDIEMHLLRQIARCNAALMATSMLGPVLLSIVTLTVYALLNRKLLPSVAFTAISVLGSLEMLFSSLPAFVSNLIDARVSMDRIQQFLGTAECEILPSKESQIAFKDAHIAWPIDENQDSSPDSHFILRGLDIQFPQGGLSVIAGRTATGKSLLLAAILRECDVLHGVLRVPSSPTAAERHDQRANSINWIIESAIAYVAQNPWTENASVKDNILFGLPNDAQRYRQATFAAALDQDWAVLPDGDQTEIGANGVNLSGGQKWRVSLARALYSRAGILVLDDIFSALDVHTGKHIYKHALAGPLGHGRTRILATHHTGLCFPQTDYCVLLDNSSMIFAGSSSEILQTQGLVDVFLQGQNVSKEDGCKENTTAQPSWNVNEAPSRPARRFVPKETRAVGSVPLSLYGQYFAQARRWSLWVAAGTLYLISTAMVVGRVSPSLSSPSCSILDC